jgi:Protein of unknown function (DUF2934)
MNTRHEEITLRAYELWERRGHPIGEPEVDWFGAEKGIADEESPLSKVAREVGGALGSIVSAFMQGS